MGLAEMPRLTVRTTTLLGVAALGATRATAPEAMLNVLPLV